MEVIYYQAFIFSSIVLMRIFKKEWLIGICLGWTLFTVINLFYPPLIFIQLAVVWGSYSFLKSSDSKSKKIAEMEKSISTLTATQQEIIRRSDVENRSNLSGIEHFNFLMTQIDSAKESVIIISGWIGDNVVDRQFIKKLDRKLSSNVEFYFGYGYQDYEGKHKSTASSKRALSSLLMLQSKYPSKMFIKEFPTHEKILVIENKIVVYSSANLLNNRRYKNAERGIVLLDDKLASNEAARIRNLFR